MLMGCYNLAKFLGIHILMIMLIGCSFESQTPFDNQTLLINPDRHLQLLFSKYETNKSMYNDDLERLISDIRNPATKCFMAKDIIKGSLNKDLLNTILPTLVYDLVDDGCSETEEHHHSDHYHATLPREDWKVWGASVGAVIVISISGLVVVALVPLMSRKIYNVVTQFLIALSVGSLIGDAFLHLIPHALLSDGKGSHGHSHNSHDEEEGMNQHDVFVWRSMIVLLGIYAFFLTERLTIIGQNNTSMRKLKRNKKIALGPSDAPANVSNSVANCDGSLAKHSSGTTPPSSHSFSTQPFVELSQHTSRQNSCVNRIDNEDSPCVVTDIHVSRHLCNRPPSRPLDNARCSEFLTDTRITSVNGLQGCPDTKRSNLPAPQQTKPGLGLVDKSISIILNEGAGDPLNKQGKDDACDLQKGQSRQEVGHVHHSHGHRHFYHHQHGHWHHYKKPHGHHHGHSHDLSSVKAIAWTIIAGDGLHNFCDGIAIGASFAESLQGGLSTSIAVLCHELPHELGDFAVLLHAGMSVKAALFYNTLSSILCAAGMVLGVLLGSMPSVNLWLFLITAGMFVYIALVDMMPELATSRMSGYPRCHTPSVLFVWQNVGMIIGVAIMLIIAKFEGAM